MEAFWRRGIARPRRVILGFVYVLVGLALFLAGLEVLHDNEGWGAPRIHAELSKLGIDVGQRTVGRVIAGDDTLYRWTDGN